MRVRRIEAPIYYQDNLGGKKSEEAGENEARYEENHEAVDILERLGCRQNWWRRR